MRNDLRIMRTGQAIFWTGNALQRVPVLLRKVHPVGSIIKSGGQKRTDREHIEIRGIAGNQPRFDSPVIQGRKLSRSETDILRKSLGIRKNEKDETPLSAEELLYSK